MNMELIKFRQCMHYFRHYLYISKRNLNQINCTMTITNTKAEQVGSCINPISLKLDTPEFKNITMSEEVSYLKNIFDKYHHDIRIAGGAVRDLLLGCTPQDIDFATTATPMQMKNMFTAEKVQKIYMFGANYGTVRVKISKDKTFEITTLRIDKVADGRYAEVEFISDWKLDAQRRDFTVNAMFLGFDGSLYDYHFGYEDLQRRRIVFVGEPDVRINEDYLRIMRYFRFYGRIADKADNHEGKILESIKRNAEGLQQISGQKIWAELKKTLEGQFPGALLKTMIDLDIGKYIGIPNPNMEELSKLIERSGYLCLNPMSYMAALMYYVDDVAVLNEKFKFSNYELDMLNFIVEHREDTTGSRTSLYYKKIIAMDDTRKKQYIKELVHELFKYKGDKTLLDELEKWHIPRFPINNKNLNDNGVPSELRGSILIKLKDVWIENEFNQSAADLIKLIPSLLKQNKTM